MIYFSCEWSSLQNDAMKDGKNTLFSGGRFVVDDRKEAAGVTVCLQGLNTYIISIVCAIDSAS
jgi:hypothetical protein